MSKEEINKQEVEQEFETVEDALSTDERFIELEIIKEGNRIEKEVWFEGEEKTEFANSEGFIKGVRDGSYIGGYFSALINSGISNKDAIDIVLNQMNVIHNQEMAKIDIEKAKVQNVILQSQQA